MKKLLFSVMLSGLSLSALAQEGYVPSQENLAARQEFADAKLGIFLHWGIYSSFAQGEWYLQNANLDRNEYAKAADAFYPHRFNADEWVAAFKDAGARYITFTSRHHDGFSMWKTAQSDYNIVEATPYGKDVIQQLADACHKQDLSLHLYYSHIDWMREDYPWGRTGLHVGKDRSKIDWPHYYQFMNNQLTELLTQYGKIGAIWFDGYWDHDSDATPFDWQLGPQYSLIHKLQPGCLIGNNHHINPFPGEDIQIFERDLPGENTAGWNQSEISKLPLETCETMNGMWGYKVADQNYKSVDDLIRLLVNTAGKGANLLINIGPQANGELPAIALQRLKGLGQWMRQYGETIYGTTAGDIKNQPWGATTRKGNRLFVHVMNPESTLLALPLNGKIDKVVSFIDQTPIAYQKVNYGITLDLTNMPKTVDYVIEIDFK